MSTSSQHNIDLVTVPSELLKKLLYRVERLTQIVEDLYERETAKPEINPKARYHLEEAADYLGVSTSTLKRRAKVRKLAILYDGKTPFVMGAELLRYARQGAKRR